MFFKFKPITLLCLFTCTFHITIINDDLYISHNYNDENNYVSKELYVKGIITKIRCMSHSKHNLNCHTYTLDRPMGLA